jgi:CheY-specific phosphatase CheX
MSMRVTIEALAQALAHTLAKLGVGVVRTDEKEGWMGGEDTADVSSQLMVSAGDRLMVILATSSLTAAQVASAISGEEVAEKDALPGDAIGEILNVVVGTAEPRGSREFSIPIIVRDKNHRLALPRTAPVERIVAHTKFGPIRLYRVHCG